MYVAGESELVLKSHSLDIEAKSQVSSRTEVGRKKTQKRRLGLGRKVENCPSTWTWSSDNLNGLPFTRSPAKNMGHNLKLLHFFNSRASSYLTRVQLCCGRETHFKAKPSLGEGRLTKPSTTRIRVGDTTSGDPQQLLSLRWAQWSPFFVACAWTNDAILKVLHVSSGWDNDHYFCLDISNDNLKNAVAYRSAFWADLTLAECTVCWMWMIGFHGKNISQTQPATILALTQMRLPQSSND